MLLCKVLSMALCSDFLSRSAAELATVLGVLDSVLLSLSWDRKPLDAK